MIELNDVFAEGYNDAKEHGDNLNPYDQDSFEWEAYEDGFIEYINDCLAEAAKIQRQEEFGA